MAAGARLHYDCWIHARVGLDGGLENGGTMGWQANFAELAEQKFFSSTGTELRVFGHTIDLDNRNECQAGVVW